MLTDEQITEALALIDSRYQKVTELYLRKVGETINKIGKLNQSSINLLIQLRRMGVDMRTINRELRKVTKLSQKDIKALYRKAAQEANTDARFLYVTKGVQPDSIRWERLVESIWMQTAGTMENLSKTTVMADSYREAIDEAVQAVSMGVGDYNSAIRSTMKRIGTAGMKVQYESGARKRLDSAVRMNVLDGVRQVQQKAQELIGEEIGADGVDITAHPMSAPDHEPVQGRRFDRFNFQLMQAGRPFEDVDGKRYRAFSRPITQWNCRHLVYYILLGVSRRMYTDEQLKQWEEDNHRGVTIDGQHYTRYEATQLMRKIELQIRRQKDTAILAKASGDDVLRRECQSNINKLTKKYDQVAEAAGLRKQMQKTRVEGFSSFRSVEDSAPEEVFTHTPKELERASKMVDTVLNQHCARQSKWSGTTIVQPKDKMFGVAGRKEWNCDITLREDARVKTIVHEHLHARSISYYDKETYAKMKVMEEGSVELFAQEICNVYGAKYKESYSACVKPLRIVNSIMKIGGDYDFAKQLFDIPLPERYNWLRGQADTLIAQNKLSQKTVAALNEALDKLKSKGGVLNG